MSYRIFRTDPLKGSITVDDSTIDDSTDLRFPGRNTTGYGQLVGENFLHLLENFASPTEPTAPIAGQLWYDTTQGVNQLKVYDGTGWGAAGGLKKGSTAPDTTGSAAGDLWVNTDTQQLYLFTGSGWILVGPNVSSGAKTGSEPEIITDTLNNSQTVVSQYVAGERVMIISKIDFIPKSVITGFPEIKAGVNLNSSYNQYYGTAQRASGLLVGTTTVAASNFLRGDVTSTTNFGIDIRNSAGLAIGADRQVSLGLEGTIGVLLNKTTGSSLDVRVNNNGTIRTMVRVDSAERIGLGPNNFAPQETVDINGSFLVNGTSRFTSTEDSISSVTGAIQIAGGVGIAKTLNVGGDLVLTDSGNIVLGGSILPDVDAGADIGSLEKRINRIIASRVDSSFYGPLVGSVQGNVTGSASKLASSTVFELTGDIVSNQVEFDGQKTIPSLESLTATGNGSEVTLTFEPQTVAPYPVGSTIVVGQIVPISYRGTFVVTGATVNSVTYVSTATGAQTVAATINTLEPVGNRKRFFTKLSDTFISDQTAITAIEPNDEFVVSRAPFGLKKITKANLWASITGIPVGAIMPYAGPVAPAGWLLCDGAEVKTADYSGLFEVIKYTYGDSATLLGLGTFKLPDFRGRFPLGVDNMNNGIKVPQGPGSGSGWDPANEITTVSANANRVTDPKADINSADPYAARSGGGVESVTLQKANLPDHEHDLRGDAGNPYFAFNNFSGTPTDGDATSGVGSQPENTGLGQYLNNSGGILTDPPGTFSQTAVNIMNPFMAMNFIIYTGA